MPLSNTDLANKLDTTIDGWQLFVDEVVAWSTDQVDTVNFTDPQTQLPINVATLWKITTDYANLTGSEWAMTPEDVLVPSGNMVDEYSCYHWFKKTEEVAAGVSSIATEVSLVLQYKTDAETAATAASLSASNASTSESNAASSESNASTSALDAGTDASNAAASAVVAEDWATELEDVEVTTGKYSAFHWAQKAEDFAALANPTTLDTLTDVNTASKADGFVIYWNAGAAEYQFQDPAAAQSLVGLSDVNAGTPANLEAVIFDGTEFVVRLLTEADISDLQSYALDTHVHAINDLTDVANTSPLDGHALVWNNANSRYENRLLGEADISDLQNYSQVGHGHAIGDVGGLQTALDAKSPTSHNHDGTYVQEGAPALDTPVVQQLDSRSVRNSGTETVNIGTNNKLYLPVSGDNVTINLVCPVSNVMNGVTDIVLTGSILVKATAAIIGLSVTSDATDDDINNDEAPTVSGEFRIFKYEYFNDGTIEYLKGVWV